ncbi:MAG: TolC family protein [Gemmatimonadaceae bacterium]
MRFSGSVVVMLAALIPAAATAQVTDTSRTAVLTLDEAIALAQRNNPQHLQLANDLRAASAAVRSAYGALLPGASLSFSSEYRKEGSQPFQGLSFSTTSDVYQSSYFLGLSYDISPATFITPKLESARRDAVEAEIVGSSHTLRALVKQEYLQALKSEAQAGLQDTLVRTAQAQLELARARAAVGSGTQLDVTRAEVALGTQQVAALRARNTAEVDKLRLFQRMGVAQPPNVRLSTQFSVTAPAISLDEVVGIARTENPTLRAIRSREKVASLDVRRAQSQYLPSLSLSTGWGGFTQQYTNDAVLVEGRRAQILGDRAQCFTQDSIRQGAGLAPITALCNTQFQFTPADEEAIRRDNDRFPFDFTRQPFSLQARVSLPLFDGFAREQRVQVAQATRDDARYQIRQQELALTADVTAAYYTLVTAVRASEVQEQNAAKAREELRLTEERYRVGAATFVELTESRSSFERAEQDRIAAIYDYHQAWAALENAVGRPLR